MGFIAQLGCKFQTKPVSDWTFRRVVHINCLSRPPQSANPSILRQHKIIFNKQSSLANLSRRLRPVRWRRILFLQRSRVLSARWVYVIDQSECAKECERIISIWNIRLRPRVTQRESPNKCRNPTHNYSKGISTLFKNAKSRNSVSSWVLSLPVWIPTFGWINTAIWTAATTILL